MKTIILIIILIALIIFVFNNKSKESFDESISANNSQNIVGTYDSNSMSIANLNVTGKFNLIPKGMIIAWYGSNVPDGWTLCDGNNGTPDLRGKFIVGSDDIIKSGTTGGNSNIALTVNELPTHSHGYWDIFAAEVVTGDYSSRWPDTVNDIIQIPDNRGSSRGLIQSSECKGWAKRRTSESTGNGKSWSIMPPYYALMYIMKL